MKEIYQDVLFLSEELGHRLTGTEHEKKAARWITERLRSFGITAVLEEFKTASSAYVLFQFIFLASLFISLSYAGFHDQLKLFLIVVEGFFLYLFYRELSFQHTLLYPLFKSKKSQNVVARLNQDREKQRTVYLVAHADSATAGILFKPLIVKYLGLFIKITFSAFLLLFLNSCLFLVLPIGGLKLVFYALSLFFLVSFLVTFHTEYFARPTSGANDNASSVAVLLQLMKYFKSSPLSCTELVGVFTGAEETGCDGIYEFMKKHQFEIGERPYFLVLECTGIGQPVFIRSEGMLRKYLADPELLDMALKQAASLPFPVEGVDLPVGYTESEVLNNFGFKALTIGAAPVEKGAVPNWHQDRDRIIYIQEETLGKVFDFVKDLVIHIDKKS